MTLWEWDLPSRKWIHSQCSPNTMSKSIPYQILPSLFCDPSMLYIVIEFCRGDGSSPTPFAHSKSMKQLVQPELTRAFVVTPLPVLRASKCTWMASSCGTCFGVSFFGILLLAFSVSTLSFSSASIWVCLHCKIVYFGILAADTGMRRGLGYWGINSQGASSNSLGLVSKILLLNRSLSLFLIQLQVVLEQCNLILVVFKTTTLAFHGADLRPRDLWARVWEGAFSDHVACLATSEAGVHHSRGTGAIHHHGITGIGGMRHGGRGRGAGQWLGQEGVRGRCRGTGQCCWGKAGLGEGGTVGCGQNWVHGVLLRNDSIEPTLLGIQPFSKCFPLHIGLWHQ